MKKRRGSIKNTSLFKGLILFILLVFVFYFYLTLSVSTKISSEVHSDIPSDFIALSPLKEKGEVGMFFWRPTNDQPYFLPGNWHPSFSDQDRFYAYNNPAEGEARELYYFGKDSIDTINLDGISGSIYGVEENTEGNYFVIKSYNSESAYFHYCIAPVLSKISTDCKTLFSTKGADSSNATWHPDEKQTLIIYSSNGQLFIVDPADSKPDFIDPDEEPENHARLKKLFDAQQNQMAAHEGLTRFFNFVYVDGAWFQLPLFSKVARLNENYLLVKSPNMLGILDMKRHQITPLLENKSTDKGIVFFRYQGADYQL